MSDAVYAPNPYEFLKANSKSTPNGIFNVIVGDTPEQGSIVSSSQRYLLAETKNAFYLSLRGSYNMKDLLTDLAVLPIHDTNLEGCVHMGFLNRAKSFPLASFLTYWSHHPERVKKSFIICGHSLGGAAAHLVTMLLLIQSRNLDSTRQCQIKSITFGAPFVGNQLLKEFVEKNKWTTHFYTFVNQDDIVPRILDILSTLNATKNVLKDAGKLIDEVIGWPIMVSF